MFYQEKSGIPDVRLQEGGIMETRNQGDQSGPIFAYRAYFGQLL
jgi:hypothetical protein